MSRTNRAQIAGKTFPVKLLYVEESQLLKLQGRILDYWKGVSYILRCGGSLC